MKRLKKLFRFVLISLVVLVVYLAVCRIVFRLFWNFDILDKKSYQLMHQFWENGGVFSSFRDISLGFALFFLPIIWLILSKKLYNFGFVNFISLPIIKIYRACTTPESLEVEHITIKNLGSSTKGLDDIIADKIKEKNEGKQQNSVSRDLRKQIAAKIEENENQ